LRPRRQVTAEKLRYRHLVQGNPFHQTDPQAERIADVKRFVNAKAGRWAVRSGATLYLAETYADEAQSYDICDVHGKMCF
jgi:DNA polymerase V